MADESKSDIRQVKKYSTLLTKRLALEEEVKALNAQLAELQQPVLSYFQRQGVSSLSLNGRTLYIRSELWVSKASDATTEEACRRLKRIKLGEYTGSRVNTQSLSAYVRELRDQGQEIDDISKMLGDKFKVSEVWKIGSRKK